MTYRVEFLTGNERKNEVAYAFICDAAHDLAAYREAQAASVTPYVEKFRPFAVIVRNSEDQVLLYERLPILRRPPV